MPVHLSTRNGKYCVVEPNGTVKKCYTSRKEALKYLQAINMHIKEKASSDSIQVKASELIFGEQAASPIQILSDGTPEGTAIFLNGVQVSFSRMDFYCNSGDYSNCSMSVTVRDDSGDGTTVERTFQLRNTPPLDDTKVAAKLDPNAKVRNRGDVVFPAHSKKVKDNKDHFPINSEDQARNALSRVAQYSSVPSWYAGSLHELQSAVRSAVSRKYKHIKVTK